MASTLQMGFPCAFLLWMFDGLNHRIDEKSILFQVIAWYIKWILETMLTKIHDAYGITRPQWINLLFQRARWDGSCRKNIFMGRFNLSVIPLYRRQTQSIMNASSYWLLPSVFFFTSFWIIAMGTFAGVTFPGIIFLWKRSIYMSLCDRSREAWVPAIKRRQRACFMCLSGFSIEHCFKAPVCINVFVPLAFPWSYQIWIATNEE